MAQKISQYFDYTINGKEYKIRYKTPRVGEQISIGQTFAALKAGFDRLDELSETLAFATATLNIVIVDKPADLKFDELEVPDWAILRKMLADYQNFAFFREQPPQPTDST